MTVWDVQCPQVIAHEIGGAVALGAHLFGGCEFASLYLADIVTVSPWGSPFFRLVADNEHPCHHSRIACSSPSTSLEPAMHLEHGWVEILAEPWIPAGQAEQLAQRLPGTVDITQFRAAGHLVPVVSPRKLTDDLAAWSGSASFRTMQISAT